MCKYLLSLVLFPLFLSAQSNNSSLSFGGSVIFPYTDVDHESGASLTASFNKPISKFFIAQPTFAVSLMSGVDMQARRDRTYMYSASMFSLGLNIRTNTKLYAVAGLHFNADIISYKFKKAPIFYDLNKTFAVFPSEYIAIGYHSTIDYEIGVFFTNTNYLEGYNPFLSKSHDMFTQFKMTYLIPLRTYKSRLAL